MPNRLKIWLKNTDDLKKQVLVSEFFSDPDNRTPECFDTWEDSYLPMLTKQNHMIVGKM